MDSVSSLKSCLFQSEALLLTPNFPTVVSAVLLLLLVYGPMVTTLCGTWVTASLFIRPRVASPWSWAPLSPLFLPHSLVRPQSRPKMKHALTSLSRASRLYDSVHHRCHRRSWSLLGHVAHHQLAHGGLDLQWLDLHSPRCRYYLWVSHGYHCQCPPLGLLGLIRSRKWRRGEDGAYYSKLYRDTYDSRSLSFIILLVRLEWHVNK